MKCFFQLVERSTGARTRAVSCERSDFAERLKSLPAESGEDYVLVLVDDADREQWDFSQAPLLTVTEFCKLFSISVEVSNG